MPVIEPGERTGESYIVAVLTKSLRVYSSSMTSFILAVSLFVCIICIIGS